MPRTMVDILENSVEFTAKVGHLSRESFKAILADKSERTERLRWSEIQASGYFSERKFIDDFEFLTLSQSGSVFARSIGFFPALSNARAQVLHDEVAARFAEWMLSQKFIKSWTPEIQLKRARSDESLLYTQGRRRKFPDVVFDLNVPGASVRFALEVELTLKSRRRYRDLLFAYSTLSGIDTILFVTRNSAISNAIREVMSDVRFPESRITVLFSTSEEVTKDPANALFRSRQRIWTLGTMVQTIAEQRAKCA